MFDKGLFCGLFDFNGDGKIDSFEKAVEFFMLMYIMSDEKTNPEDTFDETGCDIDNFDF